MNRQLEALLTKAQKLIQSYQLEKREKIVLFCGIIFISVFLITELLIQPYFNNRALLIRSIAQQQENLISIKQLQKQYLQQQRNQNTILLKLQQRSNDFSLFAFLEAQSKRAKIKKQIKYMKPSTIKTDDRHNLDQIIVEMKFIDISLRKLLYFLQLIESDKQIVFIKKITIHDTDSPGLLDVTAQIATFNLKKKLNV